MANESIAPEFEELAEQFALQIRSGESPSIGEYAAAHPGMAEQINRLFPVLELMERQGNPVDDLSESGLINQELNQLKEAPNWVQLGDYRIIREIGRGGMGIVFEAEQESLGRKVALKLLPSSAQFDKRRQERFRQEAYASANLHHTNIVPVFGIGAHDDTSYFVMQYIDGHPLNTVIKELAVLRHEETGNLADSTDAIAVAKASTATMQMFSNDTWDSKSDTDTGPDTGPDVTPVQTEKSGSTSSSAWNSGVKSNSSSSGSMSSSSSSVRIYWQRIAELGVQVASALGHAHEKKILHRDIKPGNLLLDSGGNTWVTDFGLAKYLESSDLTRTGEVVGTLRYMSPEQLNGKADERSDLFALGLTLYELAALKPAYDATERSQLMKQVISASPKSLRSQAEGIPKDLETIILKCIESDPNRRYQKASDVREDLTRFLNGLPVMARRINPVQRVFKWCKRQPVVAGLTVALAASLIAGIVGVTYQWQKTENALELANTNLVKAREQSKIAIEKTEIANRQKELADQQTEVAKNHFSQTRQSVNDFFVTVSQEELLRAPGLQLLRHKLLSKALEYHKKFVTQYSGDDELQFELAVSLYYIAELESSISYDPSQNEALNEPQEILEDLLEDEPDSIRYPYWIAKCMILQSNLIRRVNSMQSMQLLEDASERLKKLYARRPDRPYLTDTLANTLQQLGLAHESFEHATGKPGQAFEKYMDAFLIRSEIAETEPENQSNKIKLASLHRDLGIMYRKKGENEKTEEHYQNAIDMLLPVVELTPSNTMARSTLADVANSIGYFHGKGYTQEAYAEALKFYELSQTHYQFLAQQNPLVMHYRNGLARATQGVASVLQVQGKLEESLEARMFAANVRKEICEQNPEAVYLLSNWGMTLDGVAATLRDLGRFEEAVETLEKSQVQHRIAVEGDPNQPVLRMRLVESKIQMVRVLAANQQFEDACNTVASIPDDLPENFPKAWFQMGREYTLIASKIDKVGTEQDESLESTRELSVAKGRAAFTKAQEQGYQVYEKSQSDADLEIFSDNPSCLAMLEWIESTFGPQ